MLSLSSEQYSNPNVQETKKYTRPLIDLEIHLQSENAAEKKCNDLARVSVRRRTRMISLSRPIAFFLVSLAVVSTACSRVNTMIM